MLNLPRSIVERLFNQSRTVKFGATVFERSYTRCKDGYELVSYYGPGQDVPFDLLDFEDAIRALVAADIRGVA